jgi:Zn-dependent M28 family amino/carboxypeptidase
VPLEKVRAMLNFDMVGRLTDDRVIVYGVATARELPDIVNRANASRRCSSPRPATASERPITRRSTAKNLPVLPFLHQRA